MNEERCAVAEEDLSRYFRPGETCWRIEQSTRASVLIDNQDFFVALLQAMQSARRSIYILGWAFDPRTRLAPDGTDGPADPDEVGRVLRNLAQSRPSLDIRLLIWKSSLAANGSYDFIGHRATSWFARSRVRFRLDHASPIGACRHQKVIVVDDQLAFCGGGDIVPNRWDTHAHLADDPRRLLPEHLRYPPRHEVTLMVEGPAARALGDLFRERWREAGEGDDVEAPSVAEGDLWPQAVRPQFQDATIAVARTRPSSPGQCAAQEILNLTLSCIRQAKRTIYLENQYFTSPVVADALAARLAEPDGPEVVLILGGNSPSWFDRYTMDFARNPLIRRLRQADALQRFRVFTAQTDRGGRIMVHSKVSIFDDQVLRVGSANLNNRSGGFDTESELALWGATAPQQREIARVRDELIGHFLGLPSAAFAAMSAGRGMGAAIDTLNVAGRLRTLKPGRPTPWEDFVSGYRIGDPASPVENWRLFRRRVGASPNSTAT